jgi:hypothetical protein
VSYPTAGHVVNASVIMKTLSITLARVAWSRGARTVILRIRFGKIRRSGWRSFGVDLGVSFKEC